MTVQEIYEQALARASEFSEKVPNTFSVTVARMTQRQEQLFARIAEKNRDYSGRDGEVTLTAGVGDSATLDPLPMRVYHVQIGDPGASSYAAGKKVNIVPVDDLDCALAPRATFRDGLFSQVATDLANVTSLTVFYAKRPTELTAEDDVPELPVQFHELLVVDLTKSLVRKTIGLNATSRKEIIEILEVEETELLAAFDNHIINYNYAEVSRFGRTAGG
jgi:hypothetical protein